MFHIGLCNVVFTMGFSDESCLLFPRSFRMSTVGWSEVSFSWGEALKGLLGCTPIQSLEFTMQWDGAYIFSKTYASCVVLSRVTSWVTRIIAGWDIWLSEPFTLVNKFSLSCARLLCSTHRPWFQLVESFFKKWLCETHCFILQKYW